MTGSTLSGNQVRGTNSDGGGLWFDDSVVTIVNSTITGDRSFSGTARACHPELAEFWKLLGRWGIFFDW